MIGMSSNLGKVRFPIGTKLTLGGAALVGVAVSALVGTTLDILRRDKIAETFRQQAASSILVGRDTEARLRAGVETLRVALGTLSPSNGILPREKNAAANLLENQNLMLVLRAGFLKKSNSKTGTSTLENKFDIARSSVAADLGLLGKLEADQTYINSGLHQLEKDGFLLFNASVPGRGEYIGLLVVDPEEASSNTPGYVLGFLAPSSIEGGLGAGDITVSSEAGWILQDTRTSYSYGRKSLLGDPLLAAALSSPVAGQVLEFKSNGLGYLGSFFRPGLGLVITSRVTRDAALEGANDLAERMLLIGALALGLAIIAAILFSVAIRRPVARLFEATRQVGAGNFELKLESESRDELGALAQAFNQMSSKIAALLIDSVRKNQLENDIAVAGAVQQTLIPPTHYEDQDLRIRSLYQPADQCGGDWWGYFKHGSKFCIVIADATGHGIPSALITAAAKSCFCVVEKHAADSGNIQLSAKQMLETANSAIYGAGGGKVMMTLFIAIVDCDSGEVEYASAGHNPPWHFTPTGRAASLSAVGVRLGEEPQLPPVETRNTRIGANEVLFLYTDGLTEAMNPQGAMLGKKEVRETLSRNAGNPDLDQIISEIKDTVDRHRDGAPLRDDITFVALVRQHGEAPSC